MLPAWRVNNAPASYRTTLSMTHESTPQLLICAIGHHQTGSVERLSSLTFEAGCSVAQTKKMIMHNHFALLASIYVPQDASHSQSELMKLLESNETAEAISIPLTIKAFHTSNLNTDGEQRRLKLELPQRPGIVLAVTELLKDHGCSLSAIDAETTKRGSEIWFEIECLVYVPPGVEAACVQSDLEYWVKKEKKATLIFDKWLNPNTTASLH